MSASLPRAAQNLADKHLPVFPCERRGKRPLGRLAQHGVKDATTDKERIRSWWRAAPESNIGLATGEASGLVVVDLDGEEGMRAWEQLLVGRDPINTLTSVTGGGGRHLFFRRPGGVEIRNSARKLGPGIDVRGDGGYVVVPPSKTEGRYRWLVRGVKPAPMPAWLAEMLTTKHEPPVRPVPPRPLPRPGDGSTREERYAQGTLRDREQRLASTPEGQRNNRLFGFAKDCGRWIGAGVLPRGDVEERLRNAALTAGLPGSEVEKTLYHGIEEGMDEPPEPLPDDGQERPIPPGRPAMADDDAPTDNDGRPRFPCRDDDWNSTIPGAWDALAKDNKPPRVFLYGGQPYRLATGEDGAAIIEEVGAPSLACEFVRAIQFGRWGKDRETKTSIWRDGSPRNDMLKAALAWPDKPLPRLKAIVRHPTFTRDRELLDRSGYHAGSGLLVDLPDGLALPQIPEDPGFSDIYRARDLLTDELLPDFPFLEAADRAHAVALAVLPFVRELVPGPTPLHLVEAPSPGTGKSLLAQVLLTLATGREPAVISEVKDDDEIRKRLTAILLAAPEVVLLDNLSRPLAYPSLAAALTAARWTDRRLGVSAMVADLPIRQVWVATGNNVVLSGEIARRTVRIRLDSKVDRPELREGWRHPLPGWAVAHRADLIAAILVLVRGWLAAGCPAWTGKPIGSFEAWCATMGGILEVAGVDGFLANYRAAADAADVEGQALRAFVASWWERHRAAEVGVADLLPIALEIDGFPLGRSSTDRGQKISLGKRLQSIRDRVFGMEGGTFTVVHAGAVHKVARWRLDASLDVDAPAAHADEEGEVGEVGEVSGPPSRVREGACASTAMPESPPSPPSPPDGMPPADEGAEGYRCTSD